MSNGKTARTVDDDDKATFSPPFPLILSNVEQMLQNLHDASFEPYYDGLRTLQLRESKSKARQNKNKNKKASSGEELKTGKDENGITTSISRGNDAGRVTKMSHPSYISIGHAIERSVHDLRSLSVACSALERRIFYADTQGESESHRTAYEEKIVDLARTLHRLSHLLAYREACNVTGPKRENTRVLDQVDALLAQRNALLGRARQILASSEKGQGQRREQGQAENKEKHLVIVRSIFENAEALYAKAERYLSSSTHNWPGKIDHIVSAPPQTLGQTLGGLRPPKLPSPS